MTMKVELIAVQGDEEEFEDEYHIVKYIPEWKDFNQFQRDSSGCLLYTSPSPRDRQKSRMPSSA